MSSIIISIYLELKDEHNGPHGTFIDVDRQRKTHL